MTVLKRMSKKAMAEMMLENNYPEALKVFLFPPRSKTSEEKRYEIRMRILQYSRTPEQVYEMFRSYLYWKIKQDSLAREEAKLMEM